MNRVVFNKPYRWLSAFDGMSDEECAVWVRRAAIVFRWRMFAVDLSLCVLAVPVTLASMWPVSKIVGAFVDRHVPTMWSQDATLGITLFVCVAGALIALPLASDLVMRDCLKRLSREMRCVCGYSLWGLPGEKTDGRPRVRCPECGQSSAVHELVVGLSTPSSSRLK